MSRQCGAFCSFCGQCGREVAKELKVKKPEGVAPPGVSDGMPHEMKPASPRGEQEERNG